MKKNLLIWIILAIFIAPCLADTFKHKNKDTVYHGYATGQMNGGMNVVMTQKDGQIEINLAEYDTQFNSTGRNSFVSLLSIDGGIESEQEINAFGKAIAEEANKGPLFILIEIDTPGGQSVLMKKLCAAIVEVRHCQTIAFIKGGRSGGAFSAGAAVSLACNKIYMAPATSIGAAASIYISSTGKVRDGEELFGKKIAEKFNSADRSYFSSLAQSNNRSGAIAKAMVDQDVEVIEVRRDKKTLFIESKDKLSNDVQIRTVCEKGELLTLTASDAFECDIADGIIQSRQLLLAEVGTPNVSVIKNENFVIDRKESKEEFERALKRYEKLKNSIETRFTAIEMDADISGLHRGRAINDLKKLSRDIGYLIKLKGKYNDIPCDLDSLTEMQREIKAMVTSLKRAKF